MGNALLTELKEKVGFPYTAIPAEMFVNGKTGYGASSLCGSLGGAAAIIGLMCAPDDSSAITKELFNWYTCHQPAHLPARDPGGDPHHRQDRELRPTASPSLCRLPASPR